MQPRDTNYRERVAEIIETARFIRSLGLQLVDVGPGWCETRMEVTPDHWQQDGYVHAGVQGAVADHTAGCAAFSLIAADEIILTAEFKVNLLRPAQGETVRCRAEILRPGRTLMVAESSVYTGGLNGEQLTAKAMLTMAVVGRS